MHLTKTLATSLIALSFYSLPALADTQITTIESQVRAVPSQSTTVYTITGPEHVEYRIDAPPAQLNDIATVIRQNPDSRVQFDGEVVYDETGAKVFRANKWKKTTTTTDSFGDQRIRTETRTETVR